MTPREAPLTAREFALLILRTIATWVAVAAVLALVTA